MLKKNFEIDCQCVKCEQNLDSNVDYNKLKELVSNRNYNELAMHFLRETVGLDSGDVKRMVKKEKSAALVALCQQIYPEFYPKTTEYLSDYVQSLLLAKRSKDITSGLISTAERHIEVSHGIGHPIHKLFMRSKSMIDLLMRISTI